MIFIRWFMGDYARDTRHLSLTEHGALRALLDCYYATATPLPADVRELQFMAAARSASDRKAVAKVADEFFPISDADGRRHNKRADREIARYQARAEINRGIAQDREAKRRAAAGHESCNESFHESCDDRTTNRATIGQPIPEVRSQKPEKTTNRPTGVGGAVRQSDGPGDGPLRSVS